MKGTRIGIIVALTLATVRAQSDIEMVTALAESVRSIGQLRTLQIEANFLTRLGPEFGRGFEPRQFPGSVRYVGDGDRYFFELNLTTIRGVAVRKVGAFDGDTFQVLNSEKNSLMISKGRDNSDTLGLNNVVLLPFLPFLSDWRSGKKVTPTVADLSRIDLKHLASSITDVEKVEYSGYESLKLRVPGEAFVVNEMDTYYEVFLAETLGFFPIAWERRTVDGNLVSKFEVTATDALEVHGFDHQVVFGKRFTSFSYDPSKPGSPLTIWEGEVNSFEINSVNSSIFSIDPATADWVYDKDSDTVISVPK